jgi:hypothetical protein
MTIYDSIIPVLRTVWGKVQVVNIDLKYGALNSIDDVTHVHVKFNQIAMKNNRLQP